MKDKVLFVIGATAVGKSKLGLHLARALNGEIVSADSMQIYQEASLMTAKPTDQERSEIPHHLIDFIPLHNTKFSVCDYQPIALSAIADIQRREKTPIVVGGTMYYVESLLFDRNFSRENKRSFNTESMGKTEIYNQLKELDPEYARNVDQNNLRRTRNALDYILETGQLYSEKDKFANIRYPNYSIIWLKSTPDTLKRRIRERIEVMVRDGGADEVRRIMQNGNDYTRGVLQSIGYKEFEKFIEYGDGALPECIEKLVTTTNQYSKKQLRWIKNRMTQHLQINEFDVTETHWSEIERISLEIANIPRYDTREIQIPSVNKVTCELCNVKVPEYDWELHITSKKHRKREVPPIEEDNIERYCEVCKKTMIGNRYWTTHINSKRHKQRSKV